MKFVRYRNLYLYIRELHLKIPQKRTAWHSKEATMGANHWRQKKGTCSLTFGQEVLSVQAEPFKCYIDDCLEGQWDSKKWMTLCMPRGLTVGSYKRDCLRPAFPLKGTAIRARSSSRYLRNPGKCPPLSISMSTHSQGTLIRWPLCLSVCSFILHLPVLIINPEGGQSSPGWIGRIRWSLPWKTLSPGKGTRIDTVKSEDGRETERQMWGSDKDNTFPHANFLSQKLTINFSTGYIYIHYDTIIEIYKNSMIYHCSI